jgi:Tfp pilus assembly pilus retraction ATPase PilT
MKYTELQRIVDKAVELRAQQVVLVPGRSPTMRIEEDIQEVPGETTLHIAEIRGLVENLLDANQRARLEESGDYSVRINGQGHALCSVAKSLGSYTIVVRLNL